MTEEKFSYFVGLDIGTTAVRCVVGELTGESNLPKIIGFAEAERMSGRDIKAATINVNGSHVQGINSK